MTLPEIQTELSRLLYRDPGAGTNIKSIENVGTNIRFVVDESELRHEISMLTHSNEAFERGMMDAMQERDATRAKLEKYTLALEDIGKYKGEGGPGTPWRDIVRDCGAAARAALKD